MRFSAAFPAEISPQALEVAFAAFKRPLVAHCFTIVLTPYNVSVVLLK